MKWQIHTHLLKPESKDPLRRHLLSEAFEALGMRVGAKILKAQLVMEPNAEGVLRPVLRLVALEWTDVPIRPQVFHLVHHACCTTEAGEKWRYICEVETPPGTLSGGHLFLFEAPIDVIPSEPLNG